MPRSDYDVNERYLTRNIAQLQNFGVISPSLFYSLQFQRLETHLVRTQNFPKNIPHLLIRTHPLKSYYQRGFLYSETLFFTTFHGINITLEHLHHMLRKKEYLGDMITNLNDIIELIPKVRMLRSEENLDSPSRALLMATAERSLG